MIVVVAVPGFVLLCWCRMPWDRGMAAYVRDEYGEFRQPRFECGCYEMLVFVVYDVIQNFYVFSLHRNPDIDDRI